jgi:hypothetical protein
MSNFFFGDELNPLINRDTNILKQIHLDTKLILTNPIQFQTFLKRSLISKESRIPFDYKLNNNWMLMYQPPIRYTIPLWVTHNEEIGWLIYSIYFAFLYSFMILDEIDDLDLDLSTRSELTFLFDFNIFYYFFNNNTYQFYVYSNYLKIFIYSYFLDSLYINSYFFLYNYYIYPFISHFFVFLNLGLIKLEHDQVLTPPEKWEEIPLMDLDYFDYSEFKGTNISDESLLSYQDNMFFAFCIYEFHLNFIYHFSNIFNSDFFHWPTIIIEKKNKNIYRYKTYLSNLFYRDLSANKEDHYKEDFSENYKELKIILNNCDIKGLDYYKNMMSIRSCMIKVPYLFFLLYTWYFVVYRTSRYNLYVRSFYFFEEYTSRKTYFILHNNPYGKNRTKTYHFKFQKLLMVSHFRLYIEERFFNKWFLFYKSKFNHLKLYLENDVKDKNYSFINLINNNNLNLFLNINQLDSGYNSICFRFIYEFYYDNLLELVSSHRSAEGWKLMMRARQSKFLKRFRLGEASYYLDMDEVLEAMYILPYDIYFFYQNMNKFSSFDFIFDIYNEKFINYFFLKDWYTLKINLNKYYNLISCYNKALFLLFYIIDPFFLKHVWNNCFVNRIKKLPMIWHYYTKILVQWKIRKNNRLMVFNYDYFHHYLNWRVDTSTSVQQNNFFQDIINSSLSIFNIITKSRFFSLLYKIKFILNLNNINSMHKVQRYVLFIKDFYFQLLNENLDYLLYMFFLNISKFINIQNSINIWRYSYKCIDYNLLYRYYVYHFLFEFVYYEDWFYNRPKRVLWIFHKKDYKEHEGILFYKKKYNEMF